MTSVLCPADHTRAESCPVYGGISTHAHNHDPRLLAAAVKRNAAIDHAVREFAEARYKLERKHGRNRKAFAAEIGEFEQALDAAKDKAWSTFKAETAGVPL